MSVEIKKLHELLEQFLDKDTTLLKTTTNKLASAGNNYGSQIVTIDLNFRQEEAGEDKTLHLFGKMCPPNEWLQELYCTSETFRKEIGFYKIILPILQTFQIEQDATGLLDFFPKCYGTRFNLRQSAVAYSDAVILLENLSASGFQMLDRFQGMNLQVTENILEKMAAFHAVSIAVKLARPHVFEQKISPYLNRNILFERLTEEVLRMQFDFIRESAKHSKECLPFLNDIERSLQICFENLRADSTKREPYATIIHNDIWVNNLMIKFKNGNSIISKFLDFQLIEYESPANDLLFFLFTSVQKDVLDNHYDDLIVLYYRAFIRTLKRLKCDTEAFTFNLLQEEIRTVARTRQFGRIMMILRFLLTAEDAVKELDELNEENLFRDLEVSNEYHERVRTTILHFIKRKWL